MYMKQNETNMLNTKCTNENETFSDGEFLSFLFFNVPKPKIRYDWHT